MGLLLGDRDCVAGFIDPFGVMKPGIPIEVLLDVALVVEVVPKQLCRDFTFARHACRRDRASRPNLAPCTNHKDRSLLVRIVAAADIDREPL